MIRTKILAIGAGAARPPAGRLWRRRRRRRPRQGGKVIIGIKFDQPGLGLKEGDTYTGFDVEVANYVAKELGYTEDDRSRSRRPPSARR